MRFRRAVPCFGMARLPVASCMTVGQLSPLALSPLHWRGLSGEVECMTGRSRSPSATALIQAAGQRATEARVAVLETLLSAGHALTHQEIEQALAKRRRVIDRVTLYRVLEWALNQSLIHKMTGNDRVWRFSATPTSDHAHFNCTHCGQIYCLENLTPAVALTLPKGFKLEHADVSVQGLCPHCSH